MPLLRHVCVYLLSELFTIKVWFHLSVMPRRIHDYHCLQDILPSIARHLPSKYHRFLRNCRIILLN